MPTSAVTGPVMTTDRQPRSHNEDADANFFKSNGGTAGGFTKPIMAFCAYSASRPHNRSSAVSIDTSQLVAAVAISRHRLTDPIRVVKNTASPHRFGSNIEDHAPRRTGSASGPEPLSRTTASASPKSAPALVRFRASGDLTPHCLISVAG
jgi:hypothetical protein